MEPGAKKRVSMVSPGWMPGTSGQTRGRSSSERKTPACFACELVKEAQRVLGRIEGQREHGRVGVLGDLLLVGGHGETALADVEDALGGAAVLRGIVAHALVRAVTAQDGRLVGVAVGRQRKRPRQAVAVEGEGAPGQEGGGGVDAFAEHLPQVGLDVDVGRAVLLREQALLVAQLLDDALGDAAHGLGLEFAEGGQAQGVELEVGVFDHVPVTLGAAGGRGGIPEGDLELFFVEVVRVHGRSWSGGGGRGRGTGGVTAVAAPGWRA
ncbi:MAG: hypothetical protein U1F77_20315 [Kiritimatiellia bacterium]